MDWLQLDMFSGSDVGFGIAFLAGVLAFFSPCILPVIPAYVAYFTGVGISDISQASQKQQKQYRKKIFLHSLIFVSGFILIFTLLGLATGALGSFLAVHQATLQRFGGVFMIVLGVYLMEIIRLPRLYRQLKLDSSKHITKFQWLNTFLTGLTFGFAWTPCIGPVLASILFLATFSGGSLEGVVLLLTFSLGLAVPFIITALLIQSGMPLIKKFGKYIALVQKVAGAFIMVLGILLLTGYFNTVLYYFISISNPML